MTPLEAGLAGVFAGMLLTVILVTAVDAAAGRLYVLTALSLLRFWLGRMRARVPRHDQPVHPARAHIHAHETAGERVADAVVAGMGSWRFILAQTAIVALWIACNLVGWRLRWDAYPFILLNLVFSTQAAYASPLILMAGNRSAARDRKRDDTEAEEVAQLTEMNRQQLAILKGQDEILAELRALAARSEGDAA